jgi:tRNA pseudouridine55 synthase
LKARSRGRAVDGLLLLDKPTGITSNTALRRARRVLQAEKAGHTGTLDPLASGLLPLCLGQAAKFARFLLDADKRYSATVSFGLATTTGDADGEALERRPVAFDEAALRAVLARFTGVIDQVPPMYSALKRNGRPLYEYARAGIELEREARRVTVHAVELLGLERAGADDLRATLDITCSKGTYIRSLAMDIGEALGCGAHLAALRRTETSGWTLGQAVSLADFEALSADEAAARLLHPRQMVVHLPTFRLDDARSAQRFARGQHLSVDAALAGGTGEGPLAVWGPGAGDSAFLGVAEIDARGVLCPLRLMAPVA